MRFSIVAAALWLALGAGLAHADPYEGVPNPRYPDGTGDSEVDQLNRGQLDPSPPYGPPARAYDGQPVMGRGMYGAPPPGYAPPAYAPPAYAPPAYAAPAYAAPVYAAPPPDAPPPAVPPGLYGAPPAMYGAPPPPPPND